MPSSGAQRSTFNAQRHGERGQTLILAILILLAVAAIAALFVAIISANVGRTGRQANVAAVASIAEAGVRYADYQLTSSADGADWRPVSAFLLSPYPYQFGDGEYSLTLTYPGGTGDLARFIRIDCSARLRSNPFLKRSLRAYKPLLLTDYLRFITNRDHTNAAAQLGVPDIISGDPDAPVAYTSSFYGPIRANSNLEWNGSASSAIYMYLLDDSGLSYPRMDKVEVAGRFSGTDNLQVRLGDAGGYDPNVPVYLSIDPNFTTLGGHYLDNSLVNPEGSLRHVREQMPPSIDGTDTAGMSRYQMLTGASGTGDNGWYGYGQGIYIDNFGDLQDNATLHSEWITPTPADHHWDTAGWSYTPPGIEIILHATDYSNEQGLDLPEHLIAPTLEIIRHDAGNFYTWDGAALLSDPTDSLNPQNGPYYEIRDADNHLVAYGNRKYLLRPYPQNGVIYAEGNIRISGMLPPATQVVPNKYYDVDPNTHTVIRFYDLTVVSGGTIYIEGDLISPRHFVEYGGTIGGFNPVTNPSDEIRNSRLALLARDNVCLNMTAVGAKLDPDPLKTTATWNTNMWELSAAQPSVAWTFRSFQPTVSAMLYIRHAGLLAASPGWWTDPDTSAPYPSFLSLTVDTTAFAWDGAAGTLFGYHPTLYATPSLTTSPRVVDTAPGVPSPAGSDWEVSVRADSAGLITSGTLASIIASRGVSSQNDVAIAGFQVLPSRVNIDALIYAQNGSWFVLPGPWFNGDWNYTGSPVGGLDQVLSYQICLGTISDTSGGLPQPMVNINGAISENHTTSVANARTWLSRWSGTQGLIQYTFDAGLRSAPYQAADANGNLLGAVPRLPKLPCPPGLILWEEQP